MITQKIAYWYIDLWPDYPLGWYQIPRIDLIGDILRLSINNINSYLIDEIVEACDIYLSEAEILTFLYIMYYYSNEAKLSTGVGIKGMGRFCMQQIRHRATSDELQEMARGAFLGLIGGSLIQITVANPVLESLKLYEQSSREIKIAEEKVEKGYVFTCKSLISYIFNTPENVTISDEFLPKIEAYTKTFKEESVKLQVVEIAVNEGTTKQFMQAVLTELVQNSLDAIRGNPAASKGQIDLSVNKNSLRVMDNIGIPNSSFLALLIPFLSSKDPNDPNVTGEMGTGFFNVYRQPLSKRVIIDTVLDHRRIYIQAIPLLRDGIVHDIEYNLNIFASQDANYTSVTINFNHDHALIIQSITDAQLYAKNYLGFTGVPTTINAQLIKETSTLILQSKIGSVYLTDNKNIQSFVMTNNVPFAPLKVFVVQFDRIYQQFLRDGGTRIIFNFNKNVYTPSQSRTKVNIPREQEKAIVEFINNGLYLSILTMYARGDIDFSDSIIPNTSSTANISQLKFGSKYQAYNGYPESSISSMYLYTNYFTLITEVPIKFPTKNTHISIRELIDEIIDVIEEEKIVTTKGLFVTHTQNPVWLAIGKWFSNKDIKSLVKEVVVISGVASVPGNQVNIKAEAQAKSVPFAVLQGFVNLYWDICRNLDGNLIGPVIRQTPGIVIGQSANNAKGFYTLEQNIIFLNQKYFDAEKITRKINEIKQEYQRNPTIGIYKFRSVDELKDLFPPGKPVTTLIHEIFHGIQGDDHTSSAHGSTSFIINGKKSLSFNDAAKEVYQLCISRNLIEKYLNL